MLGTTSPWVGSEFSFLPRSWLPADSPCSSWFSRSEFWWSDFYVLFIARGWLHSLLILCSLFFFLCFLISLQFSSLVAFLVARRFIMFATPGLDSVFFRVCFVGLEDYFLSQTWALVSLWLALILPSLCCFSSFHASLSIGLWS